MDLNEVLITIPDEACVDDLKNISVTADDICIGHSWYNNTSCSTAGIHNSEATYRCLICDKLKNSNADIIDESVPWLCPECKSALKQVVDIVNS